jgi:ribosome-binding protein aMBF1 (putative translation factor)
MPDPDRLRAARESVALSRATLAQDAGISTRMVRALEVGERRPSARTADALERALLRGALSRIESVESACGPFTGEAA